MANSILPLKKITALLSLLEALSVVEYSFILPACIESDPLLKAMSADLRYPPVWSIVREFIVAEGLSVRYAWAAV